MTRTTSTGSLAKSLSKRALRQTCQLCSAEFSYLSNPTGLVCLSIDLSFSTSIIKSIIPLISSTLSPFDVQYLIGV